MAFYLSFLLLSLLCFDFSLSFPTTNRGPSTPTSNPSAGPVRRNNREVLLGHEQTTEPLKTDESKSTAQIIDQSTIKPNTHAHLTTHFQRHSAEKNAGKGPRFPSLPASSRNQQMRVNLNLPSVVGSLLVANDPTDGLFRRSLELESPLTITKHFQSTDTILKQSAHSIQDIRRRHLAQRLIVQRAIRLGKLFNWNNSLKKPKLRTFGSDKDPIANYQVDVLERRVEPNIAKGKPRLPKLSVSKPFNRQDRNRRLPKQRKRPQTGFTPSNAVMGGVTALDPTSELIRREMIESNQVQTSSTSLDRHSLSGKAYNRRSGEMGKKGAGKHQSYRLDPRTTGAHSLFHSHSGSRLESRRQPKDFLTNHETEILGRKRELERKNEKLPSFQRNNHPKFRNIPQRPHGGELIAQAPTADLF
jgi:hypothetical protein